MTKRISMVTVFIALLIGYGVTATGLKKERVEFIEDQFLEYTLPSALLKPLSLEFKGLMSDILLVKFMTFVGGKTERLDQFTDEDWGSIKHTLNTITDLDPYFWDAYLFSQVFLTWDKKNYRAANELLAKARNHLPANYRIPYYMGLNYYNFGKDSANGAKYLMEASKIPGAPFYLATLAARLSAYSSDYQRGIIFLSEMLKQTTDTEIAEQYKLRIQILAQMNGLEQLVAKFRAKFNRAPAELAELVAAGLIQQLPVDPYGGQFFINQEGRIDTTSKMVKK
ncbi:MAG: hypothetical protein RBT11_14350 [Desulfobacterales bacterium]|jgi:hypothetical protein|nr:hypothetical protein [Desulfobacterales bacterium]